MEKNEYIGNCGNDNCGRPDPDGERTGDKLENFEEKQEKNFFVSYQLKADRQNVAKRTGIGPELKRHFR